VPRDGKAVRTPEFEGAYKVPTVEPGFFIAMRKLKENDRPSPPRTGGRAALPMDEAWLYTEGRQKLFPLKDVADPKGGPTPPWEDRIHYFPTAGLLLTLDKGLDKLVLRRIDLAKELESATSDYLFVASRPPVAVAGKRLDHRLDVRSRKGGVKVTLTAGPDGLGVTPEGRLTWDVPANFGEPEVEVTVTLRDVGGQEMPHRFIVPVVRP
jgi:hypothetical protein